MKIAVMTIISLGVAVIVSAATFLMIDNWNFIKIKDSFMKEYFDVGNKTKFQKVTIEEFANLINSYWSDCNRQNSSSFSVYLKGSGNLSKASIFNISRQLGWCDSLQSVSNECGSREDMVIGNISLPNFVSIRCFNESLIIY